jgi:oxygen-independent coproporphyrinogen-3 oxidase
MLLNRDGFGIWSLISKRVFQAVFTKPNVELINDFKNQVTYDSKEIALYIHFPFCNSLCLFCPYVRYPLKKFGGEIIPRYVEALKSEVELYGSLLKDLDFKIIDVHIGGGTPSLLEPEHFKTLVESIEQNFGIKVNLVIEANPNDLVDQTQTFKFVDVGIDEISLGVQSFNIKTLKMLGRTHEVSDSIKAIQTLPKRLRSTKPLL